MVRVFVNILAAGKCKTCSSPDCSSDDGQSITAERLYRPERANGTGRTAAVPRCFPAGLPGRCPMMQRHGRCVQSSYLLALQERGYAKIRTVGRRELCCGSTYVTTSPSVHPQHPGLRSGVPNSSSNPAEFPPLPLGRAVTEILSAAVGEAGRNPGRVTMTAPSYRTCKHNSTITEDKEDGKNLKSTDNPQTYMFIRLQLTPCSKRAMDDANDQQYFNVTFILPLFSLFILVEEQTLWGENAQVFDWWGWGMGVGEEVSQSFTKLHNMSIYII